MKIEFAGNLQPFPAQARQVGMIVAALATCFFLVALAFPLGLGVACAAVLVVALLTYLICELVEGRADTLLVFWIALFPLGYYFLSYPRERSVINFDRVTVVLLAVASLCAFSEQRLSPRALRKAFAWWAVFLGVAAISLLKAGSSNGVMAGARLCIDAFLLPAILAWYVLRQFPARRYAALVHGLVCISCIYMACIGAIELYTGEDLLPLPGGGAFFAGAGQSALIRVNGPFASNVSYALIGLISLWFLLFLRKNVAPHFGVKFLHCSGVVAAVLVTLLPLFRSVILTLFALAIVYVWQFFKRGRIVLLVTAVTVLAAALLAVNLYLPDLYAERTTDPTNLVSRFAQQRQNLEVFLQNPLLGTGVGNFTNFVRPLTPYSGVFAGIEPADSPHNALVQVLAETGIFGFIPFAAALLCLASALLRLRRTSPLGQSAFLFVAFITLTYWLTGMTEALTTSYDLNLWCMFAIAYIYRFAIEAKPAIS